MSDVTLTFDINPFKKAFATMSSIIDKFSDKLENLKKDTGLDGLFGKNVPRTVPQIPDGNRRQPMQTKQRGGGGGGTGLPIDDMLGGKGGGALKMAGAIMKIAAILGVVVGLVKSVLDHIPEIGRTFKIVGDIFFRNFLYPLRQEMIPLLQQLLDWVRDNRAMFVRWGNTVANIFRAIVSIAKLLWDNLKALWTSFVEELQKSFGILLNSIEQSANILLFKATAVIQFIVIALKPFFSFIGKMFAWIIGLVKDFIDGFMAGLGDLTPALDDFKKTLQFLQPVLNALAVVGKVLRRVFRGIGIILGTLVKPMILALSTAIDYAVYGVNKLVLGLQKLWHWRKGNHAQLALLKRKEADLDRKFDARTAKRNKMLDSHMHRSANEFRTRVLGLKALENRSNTTNNNNTSNTINVNVRGGNTNQQTGHIVGRTVSDHLRNDKTRKGR